jgi:uncharacterized membrane protein
MPGPAEEMSGTKERLYHRLFVVAVLLKGLNGLLELVTGASVLAIGHAGLADIVTVLTGGSSLRIRPTWSPRCCGDGLRR